MMKDRGTIYLNPSVDSDILNYINKDLKEKFSAYVKRLIRTDMYSNKLAETTPQKIMYHQPRIDEVVPTANKTEQVSQSQYKIDDRLDKIQNILDKLTMQHILTYGVNIDSILNAEEYALQYPPQSLQKPRIPIQDTYEEPNVTEKDLLDKVPTAEDSIQLIHQILQEPLMYEKLKEMQQQKEQQAKTQTTSQVQQVQQIQKDRPITLEKPKNSTIQRDIARLINNQTSN